MSLPQFPDVPEGYTIDDSIAQIITSVAMEEIGLSHIINAEGEKLQYILGTLEGASPLQTPPTLDQILEVNDSVKDMLNQVSFSQMFLMGKMQAALNAYGNNPTPPTPGEIENILVAAGTGRIEQSEFGMIQYIVPFGPDLLNIGNDVTHTGINAPFVINVTGQYEIHYQLAVEMVSNDVAVTNFSFEAELTSQQQGVLDSVNFTTDFNLQQRTVPVVVNPPIILHLQQGDTLRLWLRNVSSAADIQYQSMRVHSQAITIMRIGN